MRDGGVVRVLIADGQPFFRAGFAQLIGGMPGLEVVGLAADVEQSVLLVSTARPDVAVLDMALPGGGGIEATRRIVLQDPTVRVVILTNSETDVALVDALRAGASGYLLKETAPEAIVLSIEVVMAGERVISPDAADRMLATLPAWREEKKLYDGLTTREVEVLKLIASGVPYKQIALQFEIGHKTVRKYVSNIYAKLAVADRSQMTLYAVRKGLVEL
jgi:DNA-binding NarL/FixJ family response regulator